MTEERGGPEQQALLRQVKGERDRLASELSEAHAVIRRQQDTIDRLVEQQEHWQVLLRDAQTELRQFHRSLLGAGAEAEAPQGFVREAREPQRTAEPGQDERGAASVAEGAREAAAGEVELTQPVAGAAPGQDELEVSMEPVELEEASQAATGEVPFAQPIAEAGPGQSEMEAAPEVQAVAAEGSTAAMAGVEEPPTGAALRPEAGDGAEPMPSTPGGGPGAASPEVLPVPDGAAAFAPGSLRAKHGMRAGHARRRGRR